VASVSPHSHWEYLPTVVIVDDDANVREALFGLLTSVGFTVAVFSSVKELVANGPLDQSGCLILDVRMPGQSGLEFQEQLLRANARRPIIFISGHADVPMSVRAMKGGAIEFLTKPIP